MVNKQTEMTTMTADGADGIKQMRTEQIKTRTMLCGWVISITKRLMQSKSQKKENITLNILHNAHKYL